ncbi:MAG: L,D-transpeptidase family protein [Verrucomicrobiota bacterium]
MNRRLLPLLAFLAVGLIMPASSRAMERPSFHTEGTPTGKPTGPLKPGEYWWAPNISPDGPVVVLISLPQQIMNVYRNGVIVARSSISSGMQGHSTPTGVFTILEKSVDHYSKTYDNAPMPYMERLTWDGVAFHSGYLPGQAASHGCIRLPYEFSKKLFELTQKGGTVVIGDQHALSTSYAADPGLVLPVLKSTAPTGRKLAPGDYTWHPERSANGPVSIVLSAADRTLYVYRNGVSIGRAGVRISGMGKFGNHVFTRIAAPGDTTSRNRWMTVGKGGRRDGTKFDSLRKRIDFSPGFREKLQEIVVPGTTVVITDLPVAGKRVRDVSFGN